MRGWGREAPAYSILNVVAVEGSMKLDNVKDRNYISIREFEKEKEVKNNGMGTNEHPPV